MSEHVYPRRWTSDSVGCFIEQTGPDSQPELVRKNGLRDARLPWFSVAESLDWLAANRTETFDHHAPPTPTPDANLIAAVRDALATKLFTGIENNLQRIIAEAEAMGANECECKPHACPKCEILYVANEAIAILAELQLKTDALAAALADHDAKGKST